MNLEANINIVVSILVISTLLVVFLLLKKDKKELQSLTATHPMLNSIDTEKENSLKNALQKLQDETMLPRYKEMAIEDKTFLSRLEKIHGNRNSDQDESIPVYGNELLDQIHSKIINETEEEDSESRIRRILKINKKEKNKKEGRASIPVYSTDETLIPEFEKSEFHFSPLALLGGYFGKTINIIPNPALNESVKLFEKREFFFRLQTFFNNIVKDGDYKIEGIHLARIKKSIWTGDFSKITKTIDEVNKLAGFSKEADGYSITGDSILAGAASDILGSHGYGIYTKDVEIFYEKKNSDTQMLLESLKNKKKNSIDPTPEEIEAEKLRKTNIEVINELVCALKKKKLEPVFRTKALVTTEAKKKEGIRLKNITESNLSFLESIGWEFLSLDIAGKTLHIRMPYKDIFQERTLNVVKYYKNSGNLQNIQFYLS